jgi:xanthine dehydrogenase iron-sulfur cluster and FAD-binding subunit A
MTQQITGYRQLSEVEVQLMNRAKALGQQYEQLIAEVRQHLSQQRNLAGCSVDEHSRITQAEPDRWLAMGRTDIQVGTMKIVRSVAQPSA